jgi:hypothetical protein
VLLNDDLDARPSPKAGGGAGDEDVQPANLDQRMIDRGNRLNRIK